MNYRVLHNSLCLIGTPITPTNMLKHFENKLTSIGLPIIRFSDLRDTTASLLLEKKDFGTLYHGIPLNTYHPVINSMSGAVADAMDEIVGQTG